MITCVRCEVISELPSKVVCTAYIVRTLINSGVVWGDRFIITPSEIFNEKGTFYSALVIYSVSVSVCLRDEDVCGPEHDRTSSVV